MPTRRSRFDDTTEHLRDVAARLVVERGARAVTLESLSEHGYASVGSVYERWASREALLDDVVGSRFAPLWVSLVETGGADLASRLHTLMQTPVGDEASVWLVEMLHVARDVPQLAHHARQAVEKLAGWCRVGDGLTSHEATVRGAQWWLVANVVGYAQLRLGGARLPHMAPAVARLASQPVPGAETRVAMSIPVESLPGAVPPESRPLDATAHHLVGVTRRLIAEAGGDTSVRAVLAETGVAPGSLYRRFDSKRTLLLGVLEAELVGASYDWVQGLVDATRSNDPIGELARVFRTRFDTLHDDIGTRNVILELTAQARNDEALRSTVIAQVEHVASVRAAFFERFAAVGLLAPDLTPEICGWLVQCPAAGYRLLVGAGFDLHGDDVDAGVARVLWNVASP